MTVKNGAPRSTTFFVTVRNGAPRSTTSFVTVKKWRTKTYHVFCDSQEWRTQVYHVFLAEFMLFSILFNLLGEAIAFDSYSTKYLVSMFCLKEFERATICKFPPLPFLALRSLHLCSEDLFR